MLLCTAALLFLVAFTFARKDARGGTTLPLILWFGLAGGLGLRALAYLANTAPSAGLGFDLFAGQAVLQGLNPYAYSAEALLGGGLRVGEAALERSRDLVAGSPQLNQWLTQVTPAETKVNTALLTLPFLALSQVLTPGSPQAWYGILLASDACTLALLFLLLRRLRRPLGWALLFWVNPIWLFAVFLPGASMALLGPLLLLAVWASISERSALAGFLLALAAAFNVWLAALLALFLRSAGRRPSAWRRAAYGLVGFILISALLWSLHLAFGAQGHWFGGLTAAPVSGIDPLGYLLPQDGSSGWVAGFARLVPSLFLVALFIAGGLCLAPVARPRTAHDPRRFSRVLCTGARWVTPASSLACRDYPAPARTLTDTGSGLGLWAACCGSFRPEHRYRGSVTGPDRSAGACWRGWPRFLRCVVIIDPAQSSTRTNESHLIG